MKGSKIISIVNLKGGVGKTTLAQNMGAELYNRGFKVLYIDLDIQQNLTMVLNGKKQSKTIYDVLTTGSTAGAIQQTSQGDLIAGDIRLLQLKELPPESLKNALKGLEYDFIIIDTPPRFDALINNSLITADEVLMPVNTDLFSYQGLSTEAQLIDRIKTTWKSNVKISGIVINSYDGRSKLNQQFYEGIKAKADQIGAKLYTIRKNVAISKAQDFQQNIFEYEPKSKGAEDYKKLVEEYLQ